MRVRPRLGGEYTRKLKADSSVQMVKPFEEKEIWEALKECSSSNAPGPDGSPSSRKGGTS